MALPKELHDKVQVLNIMGKEVALIYFRRKGTKDHGGYSAGDKGKQHIIEDLALDMLHFEGEPVKSWDELEVVRIPEKKH